MIDDRRPTAPTGDAAPRTAGRDALVAGWVALAGGSPASRATGAELIARWAEPHRRYHTPHHLAAVLAAIDHLAEQADDPVAVRLAAWFHDAVYDGRPGWDEERSAQLAQARLPRCGVPAPRVAEVARLVRLTAAHETLADGDADGAVLCDADLAVLGGPGYDAYARAIREEYAHVPDDLFRKGRAEVLRRLLATPRLYRTAKARDLWEDRARANMAAELAALAAAQPGGDQTP
ncbi:HD domain-containing protein [Nonomuraea sp. SYSU D8015]|uniref:HD domain-containing protein n=1 Tax=Nonomuraea sp. SYSU D8015 TaxID=2593644 RepID=UPI001CB70231|nr:metal-dependent phosphohydrolase [Nonomuraea sp. SYSU D8015]